MCNFNQLIQIRNIDKKYLLGFTKVVMFGNLEEIKSEMFTKSGKFRTNIPFDYLNLETEEIVSSRYERELLDAISSTKIKDRTPEQKKYLKNFVKVYKQDIEQIYNSCYLLNEETGESLNIFQVVPCGRCILCKNKQRLNWSQKNALEIGETNNLPLFVTLTYNDENYRDLNHKEQVREMQLFFKRLRKAYKDTPIKYFLCSEYGTKHNRLHYHLLIHNIPVHLRELEQIDKFNNVWAPKFYHYIKDAWQNKGNINVKTAKSSKVVNYITKYMAKQLGIKLQSQNLGKNFLLNFEQYIKNNPTERKITYQAITGEMQDVYLNTYILNTIIPTFARSVDIEFRNRLEKMFVYLEQVNDYYVWKEYHEIIERHFGNYLYKLFDYQPNFKKSFNVDFLLHDYSNRNELGEIFRELLKRKQEIKDAIELHNIRLVRETIFQFVDTTQQYRKSLEYQKTIRTYDNQ